MKRGLSFVLMGPPGSGKTYSTATLAAMKNKRVCHIFIENSLDVYLDALKKMYGQVPDNVHWHELIPQGDTLDDMLAKAEFSHGKGNADLVAWKSNKKRTSTDYIDFIKCLQNYKCDRTGQELGSVTTWDSNTILVIDSLTALCDIIWNHYYGNRIDIEPKEYGVGQDALLTLLSKFCWSSSFSFVITAHTEERETGRKTEVFKLYPKTMGGKLKDILGGYFTAVILAKRMGANWQWDTQTAAADIKVRASIPMSSSLKPDFSPIFTASEELQNSLLSPVLSPVLSPTNPVSAQDK